MNELTRRQFLINASLTTSFALVVQPVLAQAINITTTIVTDKKNLIAEAVKIPVKDGEIPAYSARPSNGTDFPTILVISGVFGVIEHIQDVCRRFAKLGYLAIAPDLFIRQGDVTQLTKQDDMRKIVDQVPDAQVMSDLDAVRDWSVKSARGNQDTLGITGFSWGGRTVWLYAAHNSQVKAGVAWYGKLEGEVSNLHPKNPIDIVAELNVPIVGLYGGKDESIPQDSIQKMRDRLKSSSSKSRVIVYPHAPHAFFSDYRSTYRKEDAKNGWQELKAWFKQYKV